jgi:hypothetical protein
MPTRMVRDERDHDKPNEHDAPLTGDTRHVKPASLPSWLTQRAKPISTPAD